MHDQTKPKKNASLFEFMKACGNKLLTNIDTISICSMENVAYLEKELTNDVFSLKQVKSS